MRALLQRVSEAEVEVEGQVIAKINQGLLVFLGIEKSDTEQILEKIINKIISYRVFADDDDKMNLSLVDTGLSLLLVPQFTLAADTKKGNRASFTNAMNPLESQPLFDLAVSKAKDKISEANVMCGKFQADMKVKLVNDGPVTFILNN